MATIINNPPPANRPVESYDRPTNNGLIVGLIVILAIILLLAFGLPALRSAGRSSQSSVPDRVDINVNETPSGGGSVQTQPSQ